MKHSSNPHDKQNIAACLDRFNKLKTKYTGIDKENSIQEIRNFISSMDTDTITMASKAFESTISVNIGNPKDSKPILEMEIDVKTAIALEWIDLNDNLFDDIITKRTIFIWNIIGISEECAAQNRPQISDMGYFARICNLEKAHRELKNPQILSQLTHEEISASAGRDDSLVTELLGLGDMKIHDHASATEPDC